MDFRSFTRIILGIYTQSCTVGLVPSLCISAQLCAHMSINDIPDHDGHVHMYVCTIIRIDPSFRALH